jgi:Type IV pilin-like G and H, putative
MYGTNRSLQAYFLENKQFPKSFQELQTGIPESTNSYVYKIINTTNGVLSFATLKSKQ